MIIAYIVVGCILLFVGYAIAVVAFSAGMNDNDKEALRASAVIFSVTTVLAPLWPVWLIFAVIALFAYGIFTGARLLKHKTLDFEKLESK